MPLNVYVKIFQIDYVCMCMFKRLSTFMYTLFVLALSYRQLWTEICKHIVAGN